MTGNHRTTQGHNGDQPEREFLRHDFLNRIRPGIVELLTSFECARSVQRDIWDFAVEIGCLRDVGLAENDFRWLVLMKYAEHAREITRQQDHGRRFRKTGRLSFAKRTCFVLTHAGVRFARAQLPEMTAGSPVSNTHRARQNDPGRLVPKWDALRRELRFDGHVIKRFKCCAKNQESILNAFEEEKWPHRIDDPIPPRPNQDQNQRVRDTINSLNKTTTLIRFRADGTGQGVVWELADDTAGQSGSEMA